MPEPKDLIVDEALTKEQYDRIRGNGSTPAARLCEVCDTPLTPSQKRACSAACSRRLGGKSV